VTVRCPGSSPGPIDLHELSLDLSAWEAPFTLDDATRDLTEGEWAVFGAVAAFLGLGLTVVAYICGVCGARSFWSCVNAVRDYWGSGC
jgi:hypothetical protein